MVRLEDIKDPIIKEYLKQQNLQMKNLEVFVNKALNSRKIINQTFSNRLEILEKRLEGKK